MLSLLSLSGANTDPQKLAKFRDPRIHATQKEIAKSPEGTWRPELLFVSQQ